MTTLHMTDDETRIYDAHDEDLWHPLRRSLIQRAAAMVRETGLPVEIQTADGVVYDQITPEDLDR